jgi:hypothetical protein
VFKLRNRDIFCVICHSLYLHLTYLKGKYFVKNDGCSRKSFAISYDTRNKYNDVCIIIIIINTYIERETSFTTRKINNKKNVFRARL